MEKKRKRTQVGIAATTAGVLLGAGAGYSLTSSGSEAIAAYMVVFSVALLIAGISFLSRASKP